MSNVIQLFRQPHPLDPVVQDMLECMGNIEWVECLAAMAILAANVVNQMVGDEEKQLDKAKKLLELVNVQTLDCLESVGWENNLK